MGYAEVKYPEGVDAIVPKKRLDCFPLYQVKRIAPIWMRT
jgi:hypothetical protein